MQEFFNLCITYFFSFHISFTQVRWNTAWDHQQLWHNPRNCCTNGSGLPYQRCELIFTYIFMSNSSTCSNTPHCYKLLSLQHSFLLKAHSDGLEEGLLRVSRSEWIWSHILHILWHRKNPKLGIKRKAKRSRRRNNTLNWF